MERQGQAGLSWETMQVGSEGGVSATGWSTGRVELGDDSGVRDIVRRIRGLTRTWSRSLVKGMWSVC